MQVKLSNGKIIKSLELNGNNYIPKKLDKKVFEGGLDTVTITDDDGQEQVLYNQKIQFAKIGEVETFIFMPKTPEEIKNEELMKIINDQSEIIADLIGGAYA